MKQDADLTARPKHDSYGPQMTHKSLQVGNHVKLSSTCLITFHGTKRESISTLRVSICAQNSIRSLYTCSRSDSRSNMTSSYYNNALTFNGHDSCRVHLWLLPINRIYLIRGKVLCAESINGLLKAITDVTQVNMGFWRPWTEHNAMLYSIL
jgi:hypothetical protein